MLPNTENICIFSTRKGNNIDGKKIHKIRTALRKGYTTPLSVCLYRTNEKIRTCLRHSMLCAVRVRLMAFPSFVTLLINFWRFYLVCRLSKNHKTKVFCHTEKSNLPAPFCLWYHNILRNLWMTCQKYEIIFVRIEMESHDCFLVLILKE